MDYEVYNYSHNIYGYIISCVSTGTTKTFYI